MNFTLTKEVKMAKMAFWGTNLYPEKDFVPHFVPVTNP